MPDWMTYIAAVGGNISALLKSLLSYGNLTFFNDYKSLSSVNANYAVGSKTAAFTASRGASNPATYINQNGVMVQETNSDVPRLASGFYKDTGFVPVTGLIMEQASTNRVLYSDDLSNAAWTHVNNTRTAEWVTPALFSQTQDYAVSFNKSNLEAIKCDINSNVNVYDSSIANAPFSAEAWIYTRSNGRSSLGMIFNKGYESQYSPAAHGYQMHVYSGASGFVKLGANVRHNTGLDADQATAADADANGSVPLNTWTHVCMVYNDDGNKGVKTYVNGSAIALAGSSQNGTGAVVDDSLDQLHIGNKRNGSCTFDGLIKDVRIYHNKALSAAEVMNNYNGTTTAGSSAFFSFSEGGGRIITDSVNSISGTTGTISSSTLTPSTLPWYQEVNTLTSSAINATSLQVFVLSSATRTFSVFLMRKTGTGNIDITADGVNYTTGTLSSSSWIKLSTTNALINPSVGIRIASSGDAVYVIAAQFEDIPFASTYIPTTTASVTRNSENLKYAISGNRTAATESIFIRFTPHAVFANDGRTRSLANSDTKGRAFYKASSASVMTFQPNITDSSTSLALGTTTPASGTSYVAVGVCKSTGDPNAEVYLDGASEGSSNNDYTENSWGTNFEIGVNNSGINQLFGVIERVAIYSDVKSAADVAAITALLAG